MVTVTRLKPDGSLDTTFDGDGTVIIDFGPPHRPRQRRGAAADGKIVVVGYTQANEDVAVTRINANGSPDTTFRRRREGDRRLRRHPVRQRGSRFSRRRIVVAGQRTGDDDFAVARLLG